MRAGRGVPRFRCELVFNLMKEVLKRQRTRPYSQDFQVVHFSIQDDHLHLIVEATTDISDEEAEKTLRTGVSGFAISFARRLNRRVHRKGKVWGDRHHRRDLSSPTEVRNTLLYVFQNYRHHGHVAIGTGILDPYSSACRFDGWADPHITFVETEPWPDARPRTWLLRKGWLRGGGPLWTSEVPRSWLATSARAASSCDSLHRASTSVVPADAARGECERGEGRILAELMSLDTFLALQRSTTTAMNVSRPMHA